MWTVNIRHVELMIKHIFIFIFATNIWECVTIIINENGPIYLKVKGGMYVSCDWGECSTEVLEEEEEESVICIFHRYIFNVFISHIYVKTQ